MKSNVHPIFEKLLKTQGFGVGQMRKINTLEITFKDQAQKLQWMESEWTRLSVGYGAVMKEDDGLRIVYTASNTAD